MNANVVSIILAAAALATALSAPGADYPSRPIRMLIPFPPGGGADIAGRVVGQKLTERLGVQVVIGYTQYFLHVPPLLVGFHMFGACLVWLAALRVLLTTRTR